MYSDEFVRGGGDVKIGLFLVNEEGVGDPDVLDEFGSDGEGLDAGSFPEGEAGVGPELAEIEVQREVLGNRSVSVNGFWVRGRGRLPNGQESRNAATDRMMDMQHALKRASNGRLIGVT